MDVRFRTYIVLLHWTRSRTDRFQSPRTMIVVLLSTFVRLETVLSTFRWVCAEYHPFTFTASVQCDLQNARYVTLIVCSISSISQKPFSSPLICRLIGNVHNSNTYIYFAVDFLKRPRIVVVLAQNYLQTTHRELSRAHLSMIIHNKHNHHNTNSQ